MSLEGKVASVLEQPVVCGQVARLVAQAFSNRQIREALVIAEATATVHVKHILAKLELASRAQVAA